LERLPMPETNKSRTRNRLNARQVATLATPGQHADGGGLYLAIAKDGRRRWLFRFWWQGRTCDMGLGGSPEISLAEARDRASDARTLLRKGVNPVEERERLAAEARRLAAAKRTFGAVADEVLAGLRPGWRNKKHAYQWEHALTVHAAPLRAKPVGDITTADVLAVLKPLWQKAPETASRLRGRIEHVIDAARAGGLDADANPARWRGHLDKLLPSPKKVSAGRRGHIPAMPFADVPAFVSALRARPSMAARALEFAIFTAARTGEVLGARWSEIDLAKGEWHVPPERMKAGKPHRVPLSAPALRILSQLREAGADCSADAYLFPGQQPGAPLSNMAMPMLMRRMGETTGRPHGFRSAFRDWCAECTSFPAEVAEAALAHLVASRVERAYRRGDLFEKRRALMAAWAGFLENDTTGNVVLMARVGP
jgi:integrase